MKRKTLVNALAGYKNKSKHIRECAIQIIENFGGIVPSSMEELTTLVSNVFMPNELMQVVTKVVEKYLGIGNRVSDATEEQSDALQLILDELAMYAEENNLK